MSKKYKLKPLSFYGNKPEEVLKAFMQVDPKKVEEQLKKEKKQK